MMTNKTDYLLSTIAVRNTCQKIFDECVNGKTHFNLHLEKLDNVTDFVVDVIKENYPTLEIPFHARDGHFKANKVDRLKNFFESEQYKNADSSEKCRSEIDLVVASVLLDAGAGVDWKFIEPNTNQVITRSEGLAVASFYMFKDSVFGQNELGQPCVNAKGLRAITPKVLEQYFQVSDKNPLIGVEGRVGLLNRLADVIENNPNIFINGRIGGLFDYLISQNSKQVSALDVLNIVLKYMGPIWPSRLSLDGVALGDVWSYSAWGNSTQVESYVCFHKLSQWMTYSILVPFLKNNFSVVDAEKMTGLPEYRNGGLILDLGLITLKNQNDFEVTHTANSDFIIEWRALTVILLDKIGEKVRTHFNFNEVNFPLAKVLEGGTWHAGRKIAKMKRDNGGPPLKLVLDGTVF